MKTNIFSVSDARGKAEKRLPRVVFDYIDGAAGDEICCTQNCEQLDQIRLQPRILVNTENRTLTKSLFGREWGLPFGIAPMGMCNLSRPNADDLLASAAAKFNIPLCLSTMASSTIEAICRLAPENTWFQLYVGQSEELAFELVNRAKTVGIDTLVLTVDVPVIAPRPRELRNGFQAPIKIGPRQFFDFATHPLWSINTLMSGIPEIANVKSNSGNHGFARNENRGKVDWSFLDKLRCSWKSNLVVKGVLCPEDAIKIKDCGVDAIYVSNHGGRQLDSAPAAIKMLPEIRSATGDDYTILFDSGIRNGEAIIKAIALGADFVFIGRPLLYGIGASGSRGLDAVINLLATQIDLGLAQLGISNINAIDPNIVISE